MKRRKPVRARVPGGAVNLGAYVYADFSHVQLDNGHALRVFVADAARLPGAGGVLRVHCAGHPHQPRGIA